MLTLNLPFLQRSFLKRNLSYRKKSELTTPEQRYIFRRIISFPKSSPPLSPPSQHTSLPSLYSSWPSVSFSVDFNPTIGPIIATLCTVTKIQYNNDKTKSNNNNYTTIPIPNNTNLSKTSAPIPSPTTTMYTPIAACSCIMPPSSSLPQHTNKVYTAFSFPLPTHAAYSDDIALVFIQEDEKVGGKVPLAQFSGGHRMGLISSPVGEGDGGGGGEMGEAAAAEKRGGKREVSPFNTRAQVLTSVEEYAIDLTGDESVEICTSTKAKVPCKSVKCSAELFQLYKAPNDDNNNGRCSNGVEGLVAFGLLQSNTAIYAAVVPLNKLESGRPLHGDSSMETVVLKISNNNNNNGRRSASVPTSFSKGAFALSFVDNEARQQSAETYGASSIDNFISYKIALDPPKNSNHKEKHAMARPVAIKIEPGAEGGAGPSTAGPSFLHQQDQQHEDDQQARVRDGRSPPPPPSTTAITTKPSPPKYQFHYCEYGGQFRVVDWKPEWTCPNDCCAMQCRDFTSLQHHLLAMHPYQEYWFDYCDAGYHQSQRMRQAQANRAPPGSQQKQQSESQQQVEPQPQGDNQKQQGKGHARIYSRCRSAWFKKDGGDFYPLSIPAHDYRDGTVLGPLLSHTEREMPFIYHCTKQQRKLRFQPNAKYPVDSWERGLESLAEKQRQHEEEEEEAEDEEEKEVGGVGVSVGGGGLKPKGRNDIGNGGQGGGVGASRGKNHNDNNKRENIKKRKLQQQQLATTKNNNNKPKQPPSKKSRSGGPHSRPAGRRGIALLNRDGRPKFYHSQTCVMMMADEILNSREDSDQEEDVEEWKRDCIERLREVVGLCPEERRFMYEWNMFVRERPVHADADMAETCVAFAQMYNRQLAVARGGSNSVKSGNDVFRRCFIGHLLNLWSFRLISYEHMNKILKVASDSGAEEGGKC